MLDWNPELYLKFEDERNRPARDLLSRLNGDAPSRILDVGCGPGNSARLLFERWPFATIVGVDHSPVMLQKAEKEFPGGQWVLRDANEDMSDLGLFELVFSNAVFHWMPDIDHFLPNLFRRLEEGGIMAAQIPNNGDSPVLAAVDEVVKSAVWSRRLGAAKTGITYRGSEEYYDRLCMLGPDPEIWETRYLHPMNSLEDIVEWMRGALLKQYFRQLADTGLAKEFISDIIESLKQRIFPRPDGRFLFPFRRLFFTVSNTL